MCENRKRGENTYCLATQKDATPMQDTNVTHYIPEFTVRAKYDQSNDSNKQFCHRHTFIMIQ